MRSVEKTGKTIDDAITAALNELNLNLADVKVEILAKGSRGMIGLGASESRVRITEKPQNQFVDKAVEILKELLEKMGFKSDVIILDNSDSIRLEIQNSIHGAILIGYRGQTLNAIQYLINQMIYHDLEFEQNRMNIIIDIQNYRQRRERMLSRIVREAIDKIQTLGQPVKLEPMNAFDRKYVHTLVQGYIGFTSGSIGEGQERHVVISKKSFDSNEDEI